jgi:hypothetical protein|tara:strand:- start:36601 stop:36828 length:228 start_codon:yes stop_codon:yes gene_type:complete
MFLSETQLKEIMIDFNLDFLLDVHESLKEKYFYTGLMQKSKSPDFIHTIIDHIKFELNDESTYDEDEADEITFGL